MCIRFIAQICPNCDHYSVGTVQQCKARRKEIRRVQQACFLAFWVKEKEGVCTILDNTEGAIRKLCKKCHKEEVLDTLHRHELRKQKMEREQALSREEERQQELERWRTLEAQGFRRVAIPESHDRLPVKPVPSRGWQETPVRGGGRWDGRDSSSPTHPTDGHELLRYPGKTARKQDPGSSSRK